MTYETRSEIIQIISETFSLLDAAMAAVGNDDAYIARVRLKEAREVTHRADTRLAGHAGPPA